MFHTAEFQLSTREIFNIVRYNSDVYWNATERKYHIDLYNADGIGVTAQCFEINGYWLYRTLLRVNFCRVLDKRTRAFTSNDDAELMFTNVNGVLMLLNLPCLQEWKLKRLDCTFDVYTENVDMYLRLLSKSRKPRGKHPYGKTGSVYLINNSPTKTQTISVYNKEDQLRKMFGVDRYQCELTPDQEEELKEAKNLLRVETQLHNAGVNNLSRKFNAERTINGFFSLDIAKDVVERSVKSVEAPADYWRKSEAIKQIQGMIGVSSSRQKRLVKLIQDVNKPYGSIDKVRRSSVNPKTLNSDIRLLASRNINPVCIPDRAVINTSQAGAVQRLPYLGKIIEYV